MESSNDEFKKILSEAIKSPSSEETRVLRECGREANIYSGFPFGAVTGALTAYLHQIGVISSKSPYGKGFKIFLGALGGFLAGKSLYFNSNCKDKILREIPNSNLAILVKMSRDKKYAKAFSSNSKDFTPFEEPMSPVKKQEEHEDNYDLSSYDLRRQNNRASFEKRRNKVSNELTDISEENTHLFNNGQENSPSTLKVSKSKYGDEGFE